MVSDSGCWPTAEQTLLLRAVYLPGEAGRVALRAWENRRQQLLDAGSRRLLPLLLHRLRGEGQTGEEWERLKASFRLTWTNNQRLLHEAARLA